MRDLLLIIFVLGLLPVVIFRPYIGLLLWAWISYMNPHRLTWSFAYNFRFNLLVALFTILGILYSIRFNFKIPWKTPTISMFLFTLWTSFTAMHAFRPLAAADQLDRFVKIQVMIIATYILVQNRRHLISLVAVIAFSIGFYGLKGGIFTLTSGGKYRVMGPEFSFFMDNNTFALALVMTLPMIYFLQLQAKSRLLRLGLLALSLFSILSILGTYSRGGLIGLSVLGLAFWLKSRRKWIILASVATLIPAIYSFMPEQWHARMSMMFTSGLESMHFKNNNEFIEKEYQDLLPMDPLGSPVPTANFKIFKHDTELMQDRSVSGRMDAWRLAILIANDRPFLGGGFGAFEQQTFDRYTPGVYRHAAHSNFFEVIGEQGYFGFLLWMILHGSALLTCRWMNRHTRLEPELLWARDLSAMIQVGLIGYYAAGSFLSMAYFDLPYHLIGILTILRVYTENYLKNKKETQSVGKPLRHYAWSRD
ncbi:MAG: putative O-glycosylation ligase, exosortase A system-associated [Magnetococcus sp. YQC-5]